MAAVLKQKTGNDFIDENHTGLLDMLDDLDRMLLDAWEPPRFIGSVNDFVCALENHFLHEETILRGAGYEDLQRHTLKHRGIAMQLRESALNIEGHESAAQFMGLAHSKIMGHELIYDQEYWPILEQQPGRDELLIPWSSEFETGNPHIDKHHRALINHINRFHCVFFGAASRTYACAELRHLHAYSKWHFSEEEIELGGSIKPGHLAHHATLLNDLELVITELDAGIYEIDAISSHLQYWFLNHLRNFDVPAFRKLID